jgi:hypothetical protein
MTKHRMKKHLLRRILRQESRHLRRRERLAGRGTGLLGVWWLTYGRRVFGAGAQGSGMPWYDGGGVDGSSVPVYEGGGVNCG